VERSGPDQGSDRIKQKQSFGVVPKPKWGGDWKVCIGGSDPLSQSIGRGRMSREGALDHSESRERRDKIFAAKTENAKNFKKKSDQQNSFQWGIFIFGRGKTNFLGAGITSKLASQ